MKFSDAITGAIFVAIAVLVFVHAGRFPAMRGVMYGPDLFPRIIAVMMGLGGVILMAGAMRPAGRQPLIFLAQWAREPRSYLLFAATIGSMLFYILVSDRLGFLLTSFLMLGGLLLVTRGTSRLASSAGIAAAVSVAMYLVFVKTLRVPLPFGVIEALMVR